ncbi:probable WRKY transcription factor 65 [Typha angustifolia]|uniref:probable WRKY transcription factor 65 n=1 Tax=Typha angustifolia TaxID=59011 RepID=UPI003C2B5419
MSRSEITDGYCSSDSPTVDHEEVGVSPDTQVGVQSPAAEGKQNHPLPSPSSPSAKRSRRSVQKRVVSVPIADVDGSRPKGVGEGAPPSDSWAWRKYGQKPIKGSPYPRGYYRCSSSKGCPARKQVERSRVDPTTLVITYSFDHNHPWPLPKIHHHHHHTTPKVQASPVDDPPAQTSPPEPASTESEEKFADLIAAEPAMMIGEDFHWLSVVGSPSSTSPPAAAESLLYGPIFGAIDAAMRLPEECRSEEGAAEEDALFAGLGELPECAVVLRRGGFGLAPAPWCS